MHVAFAPPAHTGVSHIMGIGADGLPDGRNISRALGGVGWAAAALWAVGAARGNRRLARLALGTATAAWVGQMVLR